MIELVILCIVGIRLNRIRRRDRFLRAIESTRVNMKAVQAQIGERLLPALAESARAFDDFAAAAAQLVQEMPN